MNLKDLSDAKKKISEATKKIKLSNGLWVSFRFDREKPTLLIHDNTSFVELNESQLRALLNFLN